jgi:hypothetical protein
MSSPNPAELRSEIELFLGDCREPALIEDGEEPLLLRPDDFVLEERSGRLRIEAWSAKRNISRRIVGFARATKARLDLKVERFGKRTGTITLADQARPANLNIGARGRRRVFREEFRRYLRRQFPGWTLSQISTEADLEHSLSPVYPRALLKQGGRGWAAIGSPGGTAGTDGILTYGLIWLDYLRRRETRLTVEGLALFLPAGQHGATCLRLRWLNSNLCRIALYLYSDDGFERQVDPSDFGNLHSRLPICRTNGSPAEAYPALATALTGIPETSMLLMPDGGCSVRVAGIEVARVHESRTVAGIDRKREIRSDPWTTIAGLARGVSKFRSASTENHTQTLYTRFPEAWLESRVRAAPATISPDLRPRPIYGQVPEITAGERGVLDLLSLTSQGRLVVLELKASADPHLPMQALDYWMRVHHHSLDGGFQNAGYFPQTPVSRELPQLILVAPAMEFHPSTEVLLRYLDPSIPVERVGLAINWRSCLKVVFRVNGTRKPGM